MYAANIPYPIVSSLVITAFSGGNCATHSGDTVPLIPVILCHSFRGYSATYSGGNCATFHDVTFVQKMNDGRTKNKHHGIKAINTVKKGRLQ